MQFLSLLTWSLYKGAIHQDQQLFTVRCSKYKMKLDAQVMTTALFVVNQSRFLNVSYDIGKKNSVLCQGHQTV